MSGTKMSGTLKIRTKSFSSMVSGSFTRIVASTGPLFSFFICVLAMTFAYRIQLTISLYLNSTRPFDFNPTLHPVWFMLPYLPYDLSLVFGCFILSWLLSRASFFIRQRGPFSFVNISGLFFLHLLLISLLVVHGAHTRLLFDAQTGLDYFMVVEAFSDIPFRELIKFARLGDCLFLILPVGLFWLIQKFPLVFRIRIAAASIALIVSLSLISVFMPNKKPDDVPAEIRMNPALFLISDVFQNGLFRHTAEGREMKGNESAIQPAGQMYVNQVRPSKILPPKKNDPWNVILFVMESVGTRYMFDTGRGNPMPMPFLHKMTKEAWYFKRHHTTSNISTKATFSLLSGLYDFFNRQTFSIGPEAAVPSIYNFLPKSYDTFLVTPSPMTWYFPAAFVKNSALPEVHTYENLNLSTKEETHSMGHYVGRNEVETIDFFIRRLSKVREPFLAIYLSFAAHFPYFDYGENYRIMEDDGHLLSRYYNNLNLLDHMIKRIYDHVEKNGLLDRTIFLIVGDHGQAFGQHHADNYMHHKYTYNENLETPAILYQPALFKPKAFEFPTSHVDILPTLLDAMRIPYDPSLFDGESLFYNKLRRKYIFFYGYEGSVSSLDANQIKVQYSLKKNISWAYDLKLDPDERNPLDCSAYEPQLEALRKFVSYHDSSLVKYNAKIREEKNVQGVKPPS
jgi:arylsulfatase A-like enzyme